MTEERRQALDDFAAFVLCTAIAIMMLGFATTVLAQALTGSQDAINATLGERQVALSARLDKIEALLQYGLIGVFGNLIASAAQVLTTRKGGR